MQKDKKISIQVQAVLDEINYFHQRVTLAQHLPENYYTLPHHERKAIVKEERQFIRMLNIALIARIGNN